MRDFWNAAGRLIGEVRFVRRLVSVGLNIVLYRSDNIMNLLYEYSEI